MPAKPIYLLADSQLLFYKNEKQENLLQSIIEETAATNPACAYIGASNGDNPAFYELFVQALNNVNVSDCKMITSAFIEEEQEFLNKADLILLAGGDTEHGLKIFKETGIKEILLKKYNEGVVLIGVSAGAIQLGWQSFKKTDDQQCSVTEALKLIRCNVLVHLTKYELQKMESLLQASNAIMCTYEIPSGATLIYHQDHTIEAVRKPINEYTLKDNKIVHTIISVGASNKLK